MNIWHFLGFHDPLTCVETGDIKFEYQSAFDLFITRFYQYRCGCGRKFWMPPGSFFEWKLEQTTYKMMMDAVKKLKSQGEYDKAIELLKL